MQQRALLLSLAIAAMSLGPGCKQIVKLLGKSGDTAVEQGVKHIDDVAETTAERAARQGDQLAKPAAEAGDEVGDGVAAVKEEVGTVAAEATIEQALDDGEEGEETE